MNPTPGSRLAGPGYMGYGVACAAKEAITRQFADELGPQGIRAVCLMSHAIPPMPPPSPRRTKVRR